MKHLLSIALIAVFIVSCSPSSKNKLSVRELSAGESIELEWGQCSLQETGKEGFLYLKIENWPDQGLLVIPGLNARINDIYLKSKPKYHFAWRFYKGDLHIHTSSFKGEDENTILVVKTKGKVKIAEMKEKDSQV